MSSTVELSKKKKLENKASLGKAAQGKAAKGKAAIGKAAKGKAAKHKAAKRKAAQGKGTQPSDKGDTHSMTILDLRSLIWDDEKWKKLSVEDSIHDSNPITQIRPTLKERDENGYRKMYDHVACKEKSEQADNQNGFSRNDKLEAEQDGSGASDRASAGAKVEETKSTKEVALKEELDLWKSRCVELESYYKNLQASVEIARKNSPGMSFPTPNAKATNVCDDIDEADAPAGDNAKVVLEEELDLWKSRYIKLESYYKNMEASVEIARKNSPVLSFPTPNAKAMSVCDDIDEADVAADDNAKATSVHDDVGVPDATVDDNAKATSVCDDIDEADVAADDNVKATSVHDDVGVPNVAADDIAK
ncbi:hypothetical protein Tco_1048074, partial [Tanacetum coccineum]